MTLVALVIAVVGVGVLHVFLADHRCACQTAQLALVLVAARLLFVSLTAAAV
ncbi:MAG: hypothetical protein AAGA99_21230 [Actinomycetota bacterium]